jgi:type I restriction enzyme S subunit
LFSKSKKLEEITKKNLQNAKDLFDSVLKDTFDTRVGKTKQIITSYKAVWEVKKLYEVCRKESSNIQQNQLCGDNGKYPIYGAGGFIRNVSFYHQNEEYIGIVKDGAVGRVFILPPFSSVTGTMQYLIPKTDVIKPKFLYYFLISMKFDRYIRGSTIPHIYFKDYSNAVIILPSLSDQKYITSKLDKLSEAINKLKSIYERKFQDLEEFKKSVLKNTFGEYYDYRK